MNSERFVNPNPPISPIEGNVDHFTISASLMQGSQPTLPIWAYSVNLQSGEKICWTLHPNHVSPYIPLAPEAVVLHFSRPNTRRIRVGDVVFTREYHQAANLADRCEWFGGHVDGWGNPLGDYHERRLGGTLGEPPRAA